jgi:hypothetical protein
MSLRVLFFPIIFLTFFCSAQDVNGKDLPTNEFLSVEIDYGHNLTFYVSANNYKGDIVLNDAARILIKSNETWSLYWSSQSLNEFQSDESECAMLVDRLSIMENKTRRRIDLSPNDMKILEGKPTMPYNEEDTGKKMYFCHKLGTHKQKTMQVSENTRRAHLKQGDYCGKCLEDKEYEEYDEDCNEYNDGAYAYDKMCYDVRYGKNLPCKELTFSYLLNLKGDMPSDRYRIDILHTITTQ